MIETKSVIIGTDIYSIIHNADMGGTHLGMIDQSKSEIKLRTIGYDNSKISKKMYLKVLMHEIVHGIDFNVFFTNDDLEYNDSIENSINLVSIYIITNLRLIIKNGGDQYNDFVNYINMCECNMKRIELLFHSIMDFIEDNQELVEEFNQEF